MKKLILFAGIAFAALTLSPAAILEQDTTPTDQSSRLQSTLAVSAQKPNQVEHGNVVYSGVFVQMFASDKPLELINPLAPADAGKAEDDTAFDLITRKSEGIKLFAISF